MCHGLEGLGVGPRAQEMPTESKPRLPEGDTCLALIQPEACTPEGKKCANLAGFLGTGDWRLVELGAEAARGCQAMEGVQPSGMDVGKLFHRYRLCPDLVWLLDRDRDAWVRR